MKVLDIMDNVLSESKKEVKPNKPAFGKSTCSQFVVDLP